ncbi:VOC family protein [Gemella sp. GH3]|uniref:VOC family protein n=1 Tax=unclassified Gemella TaxID=2624949 RepID=UPI0015CFD901|nr:MULTISPECIES: VOC family protein [unclassified Gemella]MBF0713575.1 VOC family protein [Gemella sp. GH3.1]NYS50527.1 VOC family protein [Gemella sp. GH3]
MIKDLGQVMLYVKDQDKAADFWKNKVGFEKVVRVDNIMGGYSYEVAPKLNGATEFVLHDIEQVRKMSPEINLGTPSILMATDNIEETYNKLLANGVNVNEIVSFGDIKVFNFSDDEGNYFAVREV